MLKEASINRKNLLMQPEEIEQRKGHQAHSHLTSPSLGCMYVEKSSPCLRIVALQK